VSIAVLGFMTRHAFIRFVDRMPTQFPSPSPLLPARITRERDEDRTVAMARSTRITLKSMGVGVTVSSPPSSHTERGNTAGGRSWPHVMKELAMKVVLVAAIVAVLAIVCGCGSVSARECTTKMSTVVALGSEAPQPGPPPGGAKS
jgi:hypothetical protein